VIQLHVDQSLDWHEGYSGSPVTCQASDGAVVGVLVEQVLSRLPRLDGQRAASDVLYAVPIEAALRHFGLAHAVRWAAPVAPPAAGPEVLRRVSGDRVSPVVEHWRDRDELRADLRRLLLDGEHRVISVHGRRGIGKSALVAKVLADFERDEPPRDPTEDLGPLIYLSARRSGDLTLAGVYGAVARVWDDATRQRLAQQWQAAGVDALPDLWEKLRHARPVLVLDNLDDLQDSNTHELVDPQLVALLDSACRTSSTPTIVTTSQRPLMLPSDLVPHMCVVEIPAGLTGADAVVVIYQGVLSGSQRLSAISDEVLEELAKRVDGRPRGLQKLGLLLHSKRGTLEALEDSDSAPDEVVDELISTSYAVLPPDQQLVEQLLALSRAPLPEAEVPGMLKGLLDDRTVQRAINALVDAGEVKAYDDTGLLELHPLDADHVRDELVAHARDRQVELDLRLADWWKARRKPFGEWRTLEDATPSKGEYRHRWRAGRQADALAVLTQAARFLSRTGEGHIVAAAVRAADRELDPGDVLGHYFLCRCRAMVAFFGGSLETSLASLQTARELAQRAGLPEEVTEVDLLIGKTLRHQGDADAALRTLAAVADAPADAPVTRFQRQAALFDLGLSALYARDAPGALQIADRLDAFTEPGDPAHPRAMRADIRALTSIVTGDYAAAEAAAAEGIELFRQTPYLTDVGYLMNVRAVALLAAARFTDALAQIEEGQAFADDYRDDRLVGFFSTNAAWARLHAGDLDGALAAAERGAERLESNRVRNAPSPRALADAIRAHRGGEHAPARAALAEASALSLGNPDMYQPTDAFLDAAAATLAR
jgi:tetratricopeptide (TPR) repeat protein